MVLEDANSLKPGQIIWFQPCDALELAGPSLVLSNPEKHQEFWHDGNVMVWIEVLILSPRTILIARDEELYHAEPKTAPHNCDIFVFLENFHQTV